MTYIKIGESQFEATIQTRPNDAMWDSRRSQAITLNMTYTDALQIFVDDLKWSIINEYVDENDEMQVVETDMSDYALAGPITDNRDGTVTVKMGKVTAEELLAILEEVL